VRARTAVMALAAALTAAEASGGPDRDYMLQCQGCHRADGSGFGASVPDLRGSVGLFLEVPGGREFLVQVPGSAQAPLGDAELAAVLNWMIARFGPERVAASFEPYTGAEVSLLRRPLLDVAGARAKLVERIAEEQGR